MATARKTSIPTDTTTASPVESEASKASRIAPMDFSALTPVAVELPKITRNRSGEDLTMFVGWLTNQWEERASGAKVGTGRALTVPTAQAGSLVGKLRRAATSMTSDENPKGLGLSVDKREDGDSTIVTWAPKVARNTKPKGEAKTAE